MGDENRVLPIDRAPGAVRLSQDVLLKLNAAFYLAQLKRSVVSELQVRAQLAVVEAERAADSFKALRDEVCAGLGMAPEMLRWDLQTGQLLFDDQPNR
ncbi:MAG: hypothetical protein KGL39_13670 [Patescibacteria group bacterium]|nr:hypothetical protein [Patescibacteria group bacterium]